MENWIVLADDDCYGFFPSLGHAKDWARKNFPVAFGQGRIGFHRFVSI